MSGPSPSPVFPVSGRVRRLGVAGGQLQPGAHSGGKISCSHLPPSLSVQVSSLSAPLTSPAAPLLLSQVVKALAEAEAHPGPSLVIAYSPCAMHGIANMGASASNAKLAVDSGEGWLGVEGRGRVHVGRRWKQSTASLATWCMPPPPLLVSCSPSPAPTSQHNPDSHPTPCSPTPAGYWPLYRYRPGNTAGDGQLVLDSKKIKGELEEFLKLENR